MKIKQLNNSSDYYYKNLKAIAKEIFFKTITNRGTTLDTK